MASAILLADRDQVWREAVATRLRPYLVHVHTASSQESALSVIGHSSLDLVVLDTEICTVEVFASTAKRGKRPSLIVTTSCQEYSMALAALRARAIDILHRPVRVSEMVERVTLALEALVASPHYLGRRLDRYIRDNCAMRELTLSRLSDAFGISNSYASTLLRSGHWNGFRSRLAYHRVSRARQLLAGTREPLYLIAEECGFASASRLSETFARIVGVAPRKYRERAKVARSPRIERN